MRSHFAPIVLACIAGCSSSSTSGGPGAGAGAGGLDCAWLAGDNCYKQAVAASASCLPAMRDQGLLSQDGTTCTYPSGQVVTFDSPITLPLPMDPTWKFTVTNQGQTCLRVEGTPQSTFVVTSSAGTFSETTTGFGLEVSCPNGAQFSNANALELFGCDGGITSLPGNAWSSSSTSVSFSLLGTSGGQQPVFACARM